MKKNKLCKYILVVILSIFALVLFSDAQTKAEDNIDNNIYYIEINVDCPLTIQEIMEEIDLQAIYDESYLTDYIICVDDSGYTEKVVNRFSPFERELGDYKITFEVTSSAATSSQIDIIALVRDVSAPEVIKEFSKVDYVFMKSDILSGKAYDVIENSILSFDNCSLFNIKKRTTISDFDENASSGTYNGRVYLEDEKGNVGECNISVEIIDDTCIRFTMNYSYSIVSSNEEFTSQDIAEQAEIRAFDRNGNELGVMVKHNVVLSRTGIYFLEYEASDSYGNITVIKHIVNVIDTSKPQFTLDESKIIVIQNELFNLNNLDSLIKMRVNNSRKYVYEVTNDQYSNNYDTLGQYEYEIELTYLNDDNSLSDEKQKLNFVFEVVEELSKKEVEEVNDFFKIWETIKKIGQIILGIIKWPISFLESYF